MAKHDEMCMFCGAPLPPNVPECPYCHRPVTGRAPRSTMRGDMGGNVRQVNPGNYTQPVYQNNGGANKTNVLLYVLIAVIAVVGAVIATLLITGNNRNDADREQQEQREAQLDAREAELSASEEAATQEQQRMQAQKEEANTILQRKKSLLADYEAILRKNPNEVYYVSDINNNGFPELWITYRYGKHYDNLYHVYHSEKGHAREIFTTDDGSISPTDGGRVMIYSSPYGTEYLRRFNYNGNSITYETLYNSDRDSYNSYSVPGDRSIPATDFSALRNAFRF